MLSNDEKRYYDRHLKLPGFGPEAQVKLKEASVLVIGAGGLGVPVLQYLTAAGVGTIHVIDNDVVDLSNLHRQVLYTVNDVGFSKAQVAASKLSKQNPHIRINSIPERFDHRNALELINQVNLVIDCSDNFATRYLVNDACVIKNKPFIYGGIDQFNGQVSVFNYANGPSYRCLYPEPPSALDAPNCSDIGVLGVLPGLLGTYQALEAIKVLAEIGDVLSGKLLVIDTLGQSHIGLSIEKVASNFSIKELEPIQDDVCDDEVISIDYLDVQKENLYVLDVREPHEFQQRNIGGTLIPLNELPGRHTELPRNQKIAVLCAKGIRSYHACVFLKAHHYDVVNIEGGIYSIT